MKKNYMKPALRVVRIQQKCQILSGSVTSVESAPAATAASTGTTGSKPPAPRVAQKPDRPAGGSC